MGWFPSHNLHGNLTLPFFPWTLLPLFDGVSPAWSPEVDDIGWCEREDHSSKIWGILEQFRRIWSPVESLQGYRSSWGLSDNFSSEVAFEAMVAWFPPAEFSCSYSFLSSSSYTNSSHLIKLRSNSPNTSPTTLSTQQWIPPPLPKSSTSPSSQRRSCYMPTTINFRPPSPESRSRSAMSSSDQWSYSAAFTIPSTHSGTTRPSLQPLSPPPCSAGQPLATKMADSHMKTHHRSPRAAHTNATCISKQKVSTGPATPPQPTTTLSAAC